MVDFKGYILVLVSVQAVLQPLEQVLLALNYLLGRVHVRQVVQLQLVFQVIYLLVELGFLQLEDAILAFKVEHVLLLAFSRFFGTLSVELEASVLVIFIFVWFPASFRLGLWLVRLRS
jgi:hypothetical protein